MGNLLSPTHLIVILLIVLILFGRGKISDFMGDFAKGIKSFKKGMKDDEDEGNQKDNTQSAATNSPMKTIEAEPKQPAPVRRKTTPRKASSASKDEKAVKSMARKSTKTKS